MGFFLIRVFSSHKAILFIIRYTSSTLDPEITFSDIDDRIVISLHTDDRYFYFKPLGSDTYVPARLLQANYLDPKETHFSANYYSLIVEYLLTDNLGITKHYVIQISLPELMSIKKEHAGSNSLDIKKLFLDNNTPLGLQTMHYAQKQNLRVFDMSSPLRKDYLPWTTIVGEGGSKSGYDGVYKENFKTLFNHNLKDITIDGNIEDSFIDIFSRLDAKYVLDTFSNTDTVYGWVITENGQLKIYPKLLNTKNAFLGRLAAGRNIFNGGEFRINKYGEINIEKDFMRGPNFSDGYSFQNIHASNPGYNQLLNDFTYLVFFMYTGREIVGYSSDYKQLSVNGELRRLEDEEREYKREFLDIFWSKYYRCLGDRGEKAHGLYFLYQWYDVYGEDYGSYDKKKWIAHRDDVFSLRRADDLKNSFRVSVFGEVIPNADYASALRTEWYKSYGDKNTNNQASSTDIPISKVLRTTIPEWDESIGNIIDFPKRCESVEKPEVSDMPSNSTIYKMARKEWAYYVLKVNDHVEYKDIKKSYHRLMRKFTQIDTKKRVIKNDNVLMILNRAYEIIESQRKTNMN